jgi:2,3-bisphosphoglycerate-independent phosphoglycerate mutase
MGRSKDEFLHRYGGLRLGETEVQLRARMAEIDQLEVDIKAGRVNFSELESVQRRLCELKGESWEHDDEERGWD